MEPAVPKGRLSKLWYLVRMIYNNNFTRLKHTYMYMYNQGLYKCIVIYIIYENTRSTCVLILFIVACARKPVILRLMACTRKPAIFT